MLSNKYFFKTRIPVGKIILICLTILISHASSKAYVGYYDGDIVFEKIGVKAGDTFSFGCKGDNVERQLIEVGVRPEKNGKIDWSLILNDTIDHHVVSIHVKNVETNKFDFDHDENIVVSLSIDKSVQLEKNLGHKLSTTKSTIYLQILFDGNQLKLNAGNRFLSPIGTTPYIGFVDYAILRTVNDVTLNKFSSLFHPQPNIPHICANEQEINEAISGCNDERCGIWEFFDEDVMTRIAVKGGRYKLALLPSEGGGYDIIYVAGADVHSYRWQPGALKGRLIPTPFVDTFTLYWIDSVGKGIDDFSPYATFDGIILTLNFPLQKAKFRFVKN